MNSEEYREKLTIFMNGLKTIDKELKLDNLHMIMFLAEALQFVCALSKVSVSDFNSLINEIKSDFVNKSDQLRNSKKDG